MKRIIIITLVIAFCSGAQAEMYDFNTTPTGYYTEGEFSALFPGISFDNTGGDSFRVDNVGSMLPDFSGRVVLNEPYGTPGNSTIATFDAPVTYFSITMGDAGADTDDLFLYAYNSDDVLVDSDFYANPATSYAGHTLSVIGNIAWVEYYGVGDGYNSVFWDNVSFTPVPVPGAVLLGMLGLSVAGLKLRKFA
jgi:hypothetical protein